MISILAAYPDNNDAGKNESSHRDTPVDQLKSSIKDVHIFNYKDLESPSSPDDQPGTEA